MALSEFPVFLDNNNQQSLLVRMSSATRIPSYLRFTIIFTMIFLKIRICESRSRSTLTKYISCCTLSTTRLDLVLLHKRAISKQREDEKVGVPQSHIRQKRDWEAIGYRILVSKEQLTSASILRSLTVQRYDTIVKQTKRGRQYRARRTVNTNSVERREKRRENRLITITTQQLVATRVFLLRHSYIFVPFREKENQKYETIGYVKFAACFRRW